MMIRLRITRFSRVSFRKCLFFASAFVLFWIFVFSLSPITSPLPPYTGPHEVGILDLETEVQTRLIHHATLKETGEKAFELSTLAITLYYPTGLRTSHSHQSLARPWLPRPIWLIGRGYARIAHVFFPPLQSVFTFALWALGSKTVIPGIADAPLLSGAEKVLVDESSGVKGFSRIMHSSLEYREDEAGRFTDNGVEGAGKLPCLVFTHGMAGMSQSYSHYLGSIASHGYVVAAVEHRDGSGPGSIIHYPDGRQRSVWHVQAQDLKANPPMTASDLQVAQLAFREAEIEETIRLFNLLDAGHGDQVSNLKPGSPRSVPPSFAHRLNLSAITVAGHSYGATGALQVLKSAGSESMPVNGGIALDPGKGSGPLNQEIDVPLLVLQSGEWTEKKTQFYDQGWHFDVVRKLVNNMHKGWFMTLTGTAHPSCTDAPLIVPWIMRLVTGTTLDPRVALKEYIDVSVQFLDFLRDGEKKGALGSEVTSWEGPLGEEKDRGFTKGSEGAEWEVHVVPQG